MTARHRTKLRGDRGPSGRNIVRPGMGVRYLIGNIGLNIHPAGWLREYSPYASEAASGT